jgi:hypothetical protein
MSLFGSVYVLSIDQDEEGNFELERGAGRIHSHHLKTGSRAQHSRFCSQPQFTEEKYD